MSATAPTIEQVQRAEVHKFVDTEYSKVVAGVGLITGNRESAQDAVQDAMVKAWQRRDEIVNLAGWITVVASNDARNRLRKRANERRAVDRIEPVVEYVQSDGVDDRISMVEAIGHLSMRQREVIVMHYYPDLSVTECATSLGIHDGTVKTTLHRARKALGQLLNDHESSTSANPSEEHHDGS